MKGEASATIELDVYVRCPKCKTKLDLLDDDEVGKDINDDSFVIRQVLDEIVFEANSFDVEGVKCWICSHEFNASKVAQ